MTSANDTAAAVERAKGEILADVASGLVPADVASFSDLHDYVDANEYGGLTEDDVALDADDFIAYGNAVQGALDAWIKEGGLTR